MADSETNSTPLAGSDMAMYAAIVGKVPDIDPNASPISEMREVHNERPWSPIVLSIYLKQIYRQGTLRLNKPELAAWLKKQSVTARKRIAETQIRIAAIRNERAA